MFTPDVVNIASVALIFIEGLLSFFSPCVLPLLPVYMGYLGGNMNLEEPHQRRNVLFLTLCFILGIFTAIFLLNTSITIFSSFFKEHMTMLIRISGILIMLLGIHQLGIIKFKSLEKTKMLKVKDHHKSSFTFAFLLGFTFSFSWTPCIGPALSSVLLLAQSSQSFLLSNGLMLVYALGLTIPFLILGLFTTKALGWFSKHHNIMKYTVKIGAVILILIGIAMLSGKMNAFSSYLVPQSKPIEEKQASEQSEKATAKKKEKESKASETTSLFVLPDQDGNIVDANSFKGKVVFVNFWATWCPPCKAEMPHIQELYEEYKEQEDVVILTIARPGGQETSKEGILSFMKENGYTMPVLFDGGQVSENFQINSYPTTYMLKKDGTPYGYVKGQLSYDIMKQIIQQTLDDKE